jgi:hypothetical protein
MISHPTCLTLASLFVLPLLGGCSEDGCTLEARWGVVVEIRDARTGAPIAATARGSVTDGAYIDSLAPAGLDSGGVLLSLGAARERGGLYRVDVLHDGYGPWQQADVLVREDQCHVHTVTLRAELLPVP